jgi:hypothetical protein
MMILHLPLLEARATLPSHRQELIADGTLQLQRCTRVGKSQTRRHIERGNLPNLSPDLAGVDVSLVAAAITGKSVAAAAVLEAKSSSTSRAPATDSSTAAAASAAAARDTREDTMLTLGFLAESKVGEDAGPTGASEDDGVTTASDSWEAGMGVASSLSSESTIRLRFCDCVFAIEIVAFDVSEERPLSSLSTTIPTTLGVSC